jgi:hypothetical protein
VAYPNPLFEIELPENDEKLGKTEENPAFSCVDIAQHGEYFILINIMS